MFTIFKQPIVFRSNPWYSVLIASVSVFLVLSLFQPFGIGTMDSFFKWMTIFCFTFVTVSLTIFTSVILPGVFPNFYDSTNWTWGKYSLHLFATLFLIVFGNTLLACFLFEELLENTFSTLVFFCSVTLMVGFVPISLVTLFVYSYALKQNLKEAKELNLRLQGKSFVEAAPSFESDVEEFTLGSSTKGYVRFEPDRFLYAEASGNYVKVHYLTSADIFDYTYLRTTITQVAKDLKSLPSVRRCHRAFVVNTANVINVEGNLQGFSLRLRKTKNEVPVSRSYTKGIRVALKQG